MKKFVLLALIVVTGSIPAWAAEQRAPSGHEKIPFTNTISCFEGDKLVAQQTSAWAIERSWDGDQYFIKYNAPTGKGQTFSYRVPYMKCLIEPAGKESVPVAERIAAEQQQEAEELARQKRIEEFQEGRRRMNKVQ
jgi:hypothetical protein